MVNPKVTNEITNPTELIISERAGGTDHAERFFDPLGSTYTTSFCCKLKYGDKVSCGSLRLIV